MYKTGDLKVTTNALRGVFVPLWLLARPEIGQGAKLLYVMLAQKADVRGVSNAFVPALATALGDDETQIYQFLNELENYGLIEIRRRSVEANIVRCVFPACEPPGHVGTRGIYERKRGQLSGQNGSKHTLENCVRYAKAKKRAGEGIRNVYALGTHFHKTGYQDEEIDLFLARGEAFDMSSDIENVEDIQWVAFAGKRSRMFMKREDKTKIEDMPRLIRAYFAVFCLRDHDLTLSLEFINSEIKRLGLLKMTDAEFVEFRRREPLRH
jgi:hypothetical protein